MSFGWKISVKKGWGKHKCHALTFDLFWKFSHETFLFLLKWSSFLWRLFIYTFRSITGNFRLFYIVLHTVYCTNVSSSVVFLFYFVLWLIIDNWFNFYPGKILNLCENGTWDRWNGLKCLIFQLVIGSGIWK